MRHKNCKGVFTNLFREDLYRAYKETLAEHIEHGEVVFDKVVADAIKKPAKRFWISEEQVLAFIRNVRNGTLSDKMLPSKKEILFEIYSRVIKKQRQHPEMALRTAVYAVCEEPAPKFYVTYKSARTILSRLIKCKREKKK